MSGSGTQADPWRLKTPPGQSEYEAWRDDASDPPALVVQVGESELRYHLRAIDELFSRAWAPGARSRSPRGT